MGVAASLQGLKKSFVYLFYPSVCLHCEGPLENLDNVLCFSCSPLLSLENPDGRCSRCFSNLEDAEEICSDCMVDHGGFIKAAAAFEYSGPAASLIRHFKYQNSPYLAEGLSAFLAAQFFQLGWEMPDVIVPVPITWSHLLLRGYNQSLLLAEGLSRILQRPVADVVSKSSAGYGQAGLSRLQRKSLDGLRFAIKNKRGLEGRRILLVDDVMTTKTTLKKCAEVLQEGSPASIYAITCAIS